MKPTPEQERAIRAPGGVAVIAGAGTGKTRTLVHRYLALLDRGLSPLQVVAVTFTEAAAAELRARLRRELRHARPGLVPELEAAPIGTIHALAARICREHSQAAGVPADFRVQDEVEAALWLRDHLPRAVAGLPEEVFRAVPYSLLLGALEELLADPVAAGEAFNKDPEAMGALLGAEQNHHFEEARVHMEILSQQEASGRLDELRAELLIAWKEDPEGFWERASSLKLPGGKTRHLEVKEAIKAVRDLAKQALRLRFTEDQERAWKALKEAFFKVRERLEAERFRDRVLDFAGLEAHALRALEDPSVRDYYRQRWKHALVDEHQDTNPVQERILHALFGPGDLTLVGDPKQSIYGFRRADPRVFSRATKEAPEQVFLSRSFRTHSALVEAVNGVFEGLLPDFEPLSADRNPPHEGPHLEAFVVATGNTKAARRQAEAREVARRIRRWVEGKLLVWDREAERVRPAHWSDFAVLARAWSVLEDIALALLAEGVPAVLTRGGSLLEAREVKDGLALLRFLADPADDLALIAVLRSPFFAVSDRTLQAHAGGEGDWWERVLASGDPALERPREVLERLLAARSHEPPSRLLQMADRLTGYTAVLANLPLAGRRLADWRAFLDLVRELERGNEDTFAVARRFRELLAAGVRLDRPPLAAGDAVSLLTIHAAKGLEWPVVFLAGLDHEANRGQKPAALFDPEVGVALSEEEPSGIHALIETRRKEAENEELLRLLYVGMTRAADRLVVSAAGDKGAWKVVRDHLPGVEELVPEEEDLLPPFSGAPAPELAEAEIVGEVPLALSGLPVTALDLYRLCPRRFHFAHVRGHPGAGEEAAVARRVGRLAHEALARGTADEERLARLDPGLPAEAVREAAELARAFLQSPTYERFRREAEGREVPLSIEVAGVTLSGIADLVGPGWILDFKTDREVQPGEHALQVWAYARALGRDEAYLAYLRHDRLVKVPLHDLEAEAEKVVEGIRSRAFDPTPSARCAACPYLGLCDEGKAEAGRNEGGGSS